MKAPLFALLFAAGGCVGPLVSDDPRGLGVLPAGTAVPSLEQFPLIAAAIADADGVGPVVPIISAFRSGAPARYWDAGPAAPFAAAMFRLVDAQGNALPHPPIIDVIPGDEFYSPFFRLYDATVTSAYAQEVIPSTDALEDAVHRGLLQHPTPGPVINAPVFGADVQLARAAGAPSAPSGVAYYQGLAVPQELLGEVPSSPFGQPRGARRYVLRRQGEEPLSEPARGVDLTGDGDRTDTNDVLGLAAPPGDPAVTPLCQTVTVVVSAAISAIDTSQDETISDVNDATLLFSPDPVTPLVVSFQDTSEVRNCAPVP
ncbi:MAG: hypothetical protein R3B48_25670 [Kofleriaceae bacterium]